MPTASTPPVFHVHMATFPPNTPNYPQSTMTQQYAPATQMPISGYNTQPIANNPWNEIGYRGFTKWMASSEDGVVIRRFDHLNARVILRMQDQIVQKEAELEMIELGCMPPNVIAVGNKPVLNGSFRNDAIALDPSSVMFRRNQIMDELKTLLKEYNDFIISHRTLRSDPNPPRRQVENIETFLHNRGWEGLRPDGTLKQNAGPIYDNECEFLRKKGDLVSLVPKAKVPLRRWLDKHGWFMLLRFFQKPPQGTQQYSDRYGKTSYQSEGKVNRAITAATLTLGLIFLIGPLWGLWALDALHTETKNLILISCLVFGFTCLLGSIMVSKPFETLGAAAAYAAVLMVFLQLSTPSTNSTTYFNSTALANATSNLTSRYS